MLDAQRGKRDVLRCSKGGKHAEKSQLAMSGGKAGGKHGDHLAQPLGQRFFTQALLQVGGQLLHARRKFGQHHGVVTQVRQKCGRDRCQVGHIAQQSLGVQHGVEQIKGSGWLQILQHWLCPRHEC